MKEKLTQFVVAVFLLILIVIEIIVLIPNYFGKQFPTQNHELKCQGNNSVLNWRLKTFTNVEENFCQRISNNSTSNSCSIASTSSYKLKTRVQNVLNTAITCNHSHFQIHSPYKRKNLTTYIGVNFQNKQSYKKLKRSPPCKVVNFMVAITFVKLVIVVIAYQQLLHNGYIIIQNLYHKHIRHFELLICNRPYQMKSGHGLDDEENYLEQHQQYQSKGQPLQQQAQTKQEIFNQVSNIIENFVANEQYSTETVHYSTTKRTDNDLLALNIVNTNKNQLYHQQSENYHYYQQLDYNYYHHDRNHKYYRNYYHRCLYQRDHQCYQGYCHQVEEKYVKTKMVCDKFKTNFSNASFSMRKICTTSKNLKGSSSVFNSKIAKVCNDRKRNIQRSQPTIPVVPTLASMSPTICCWKTTGSRKRRKRKNTFVLDKYIKNCNYLIWRKTCAYCYCCCDNFCNIMSRYSEYFHIHCCNYNIFSCGCCCCCICKIDSNSSFTCQTAAMNYKFYKNKFNISKANNASLHKNNSHQLNIIDIAKDVSASSSESSRKWCIDTSPHDNNDADNRSNLLRSLNAVKAITSAVHNRNYKRKLKKNLVWLFIGLVWLEGPKLINCSISHNNNDLTSFSGNETTNKLGSNQSSNSDNSSGNSGSGGGRNNSRSNGGSSSHINGPGPGPRSDPAENKGQNIKSANFLKLSNSLDKSASSAIESYNKNRYIHKTVSVEQPLQVKKQYQVDRPQHWEPFSVSSADRKQPTNSRPTLTTSSLFENEEVNRAQSDLVRLESIKRQILTKLGLTEKPNVTHPLPKQFIWDTIYRADGIGSVSDFDFNDNHRTQEHVRLTTAVLEPPPLIPHHYPPIVDSISNMDQIKINSGVLKANYSETRNDISPDDDIPSASWKLQNVTNERIADSDAQMLSKYQRKNREQQQQKTRSNKNSNIHNKNSYSEQDYFEGDDFFGSTQEIITFAEKGKIYKKHRLVEFSPPSNKIPKQKLQIRNAEIHIRIEKVSTRSSVSGHLEHRHFHRHKYSSSREPNLKIWIFQLIGNDFSSKGFDQVATFCTSLTVDHNVLGWQKLDITETVQFWYGKHQKDKLRLLIDCTGCGSRYILHLFDRKFQHSFLSPSATIFAKPSNEMQETEIANKHNITSLKADQSSKKQSQRYYYHYWQYSHHRYRRKNRAVSRHRTFKTPNASDIKNQQNKSELKRDNNLPPVWRSSKKYRKMREINQASQEELEGISYEVGAEYHLEDRLNPNRPFLVLHTEPTRSRRVRRRAVDCSGAMHGQCCKESFYVSFKALGWDDWIIAPRGYFANYCRGDCTGPYRTPDTFQTFHAHFIEEYRKMGLLNGMQPCCAPVKFSSMSLIYYGDDGIIKRDLPKMVVDECGCP